MDMTTQKEIFDSWLKQHKGIVFKVVRAYAYSPADQENLFQEISFQVWTSIPDFRGKVNVSPWIYRVALYTVVTFLRREKSRPQRGCLTDGEHILTATHDEQLDWFYS